MSEDDMRKFANIILDEQEKRMKDKLGIASEGRILTRQETIEKFRISGTTLWRWEHEGILKPFGKHGKIVLYNETEIVKILNKQNYD